MAVRRSDTPNTTDEAPSLVGYLTVAEAAARKKRSTESVRRWIASGRLRSHKFLGRTLVAEADLEAAVRENRVTQTAATLADAGTVCSTRTERDARRLHQHRAF